MFGYIGASIGLGLGLYAVLPKPRKPLGRRLTLFLVGAFLIGVGTATAIAAVLAIIMAVADATASSPEQPVRARQ
jgi:uncharacterized membrane protein YczE